MLNVIKDWILILRGSGILNRHFAALTLVCALLFTACNGTTAPTNTPASVSVVEPTQVPATSAPVESNVASAPTTEPASITANTIQVAGAINAQVEADNFYVAP